MISISHATTDAARSLTAAEKATEAAKNRQPEEKTQDHPLRPDRDRYLPEEKQGSYGRYWMERDEDGKPQIHFDEPEAAEDTRKPEQDRRAERGDDPEKKDEGEETWVVNTDEVDREIKALKKQQQTLKQQLNTETDEEKTRELEKQLKQVERALSEKDNDSYRRQHAAFTQLS